MTDLRMERANSVLERVRYAFERGMTRAGGRGGAFVILLLIVAVFAVLVPAFFSFGNAMNISRQYSVVAILAVAQTIVIISAGIDLSVAAVAALAGTTATVAYSHWGWPQPAALLFGMGAGTTVGIFNGFVITKWRVPDIIATLGTFTAVRGVALIVTGGLPVPSHEHAIEGRRTVPPILIEIGARRTFGVPNIILGAVVAVIVGWFVLQRTQLGRTVFAVGGNREAAHASGIHVDRTKFLVYVISAALSSFGGLLLTGRLTSANALMGLWMELQSIAAVVVGGTALFGGEGTVGGSIIGVLIIGVLANGLTILGVSEFWERIMNGLIIVVVVALDQWRRRIAERQRAKEAVSDGG